MSPFDIVCFSHLRWDFVYQRPQHLLSRAARQRRVFYIEEAVVEGSDTWLDVQERGERLWVLTPHLPANLPADGYDEPLARLISRFLAARAVRDYVLWYYTPMALGHSRHLRPLTTVYDCMDELSAFKGASSLLAERERLVFNEADLVFTGGRSLYEAKRERHPRVSCFPSSVDFAHFAQARGAQPDPADQVDLPRPRLGFFGVIDERMDLDLVAGLADARPDWQIVLVGPVVKIDPASLPRRPNIHYLGGKSYDELPGYIAGWDVALLPFARNEATRYISPTKTPEYLAAGKPVVSTSIHDVVEPYGERGLVGIADTVPAFVSEIEAALAGDPRLRLSQSDAFLATMSWDRTWSCMERLIADVVDCRLTPFATQKDEQRACLTI
jgi:UDP-galactopyranose mutase